MPSIDIFSPAESIGSIAPVRVGVPFPKGHLTKSAEIVVFDERRVEVEHQVETLERWPDGSVRWALFDVLVPVTEEQIRLDVLAVDKSSRPSSENDQPSHERRIGEEMKLGLDWICPGQDPSSILLGSLGHRDPSDRTTLTAVLTDKAGNVWDGVIDSGDGETLGPVRDSIEYSGRFTRRSRELPVRFELRVDAIAALDLVVLELDIWNPQAAVHPGNIWDLGDPGSFLFHDLTIRVQKAGGHHTSYCRPEPGAERVDMEATRWTLYQDSSGGENWNSGNHVDAAGSSTVSFRGYEIRCSDQQNTAPGGNRASPVAAIEADTGMLGVSVPDFWQNFPSSLRAGDDGLEIGLFPAESSGHFELQGGERRRLRILIALGGAFDDIERKFALAQSAAAWPDPSWIAESRAIPWFSGDQPRQDAETYEAYIETVVAGPNAFARKREVIDEYGWRNYGDLYADHEAVRESTPGALISHYNNQYDFVFGAAIQALRKRDRRWWDLMSAAARHHIDIDIYHTSDDRSAYNHGLFWHTEHYRTAGTATHRTYSRVNKTDRKYGGGPSNEHNYTSGLALYYLLTGDRTAKKAVIGLANWVLAMDDGATTIWSVVDPGAPTGLASRTVHDNFHGPGRGAANSINALMDAYSLSLERKYIDKAEQLIFRCIHPNDNIEELRLDQPEYRWSYLVFLQIIGKYLWRKEELGEIDYRYSYAMESLLHYAWWMTENERPYAELLDRVELPTETWPAQDIRKAHTLYIASEYADIEESKRFLEKAEFFYSRCLSDLLEFETAYLCRPRVLLVVYGFVRDYFLSEARKRPASERPTLAPEAFGVPRPFRSQRQSLKSALRQRIRTVASELRRILRSRAHLLRSRLNFRKNR